MVAVSRTSSSSSSRSRNVIPAQATSNRVVKIPRFRSTFSINTVDKNGQVKKVPIIPSRKPNKFLALFEKDDVDFEILVDNRRSLRRHLSYRVEVQNQTKRFAVGKQRMVSFPAMEADGRKLHFLRKSSDEGQTFIAMFAAENGVSLNKATRMLSQLKFEVDCSKKVSAGTIDLEVNTFDENKFIVEALPGSTVRDVKERIQKDWKFNAGEQRLLFRGKLLSDVKTLKDYGVEHGSEVHMVKELRGGRGSQYSATDELGNSDADSGATIVLRHGGRNDPGERGIAALGDECKVEFIQRKFRRDSELGFCRFVLELRKVSPFGFSE